MTDKLASRTRLLKDARVFQALAAEAHREAVHCQGTRARWLGRLSAGFQRDAEHFAKRARECLAEAEGWDSDEEDA
jgi:hypothetical protein